MARGKTFDIEGFQTTFDLAKVKTKADVICHSCLTRPDDLAYCFSANLEVEPGVFNTTANDEYQILIGTRSQ
jgi:hypothetical protein